MQEVVHKYNYPPLHHKVLAELIKMSDATALDKGNYNIN